ncbi:MAG: family 16 glycoside hydrolase, partial [Balneolales bacterium]
RSFLLSFIQRLADEGHVSESSNIARQVLADAYPVNFKSSALYTLTENEGTQALDDLLKAAGSSDQKFRSAALSLASSLPGQGVTDAFVSSLQQSSPQVMADVVTMLGNRGDKSALSTLRPFLTESNLAVRLSSIQAVASLGGTDVMSELFETLDQAQQAEEITTIKNSLLQLSPNDLLPAVSSAFQTASDQSKVVFIEILAERGASGYLDIVLNQHNTAGSEVRLAVFHALNKLATPADLPRIIRMIPEAQNTDERNAIQSAIVSVSNDIPEAAERADAVLRALNEASDSDRPHLLELLPGIGGDQALTEVAAAVNSSDDAVQNSAILALSEWEDVAAIPALLEVFKTASSSERTRVLEGYVRLVNHSSNPASEKVQLLQDAAFASEAVQEKVIVLRALSEVNDPVALQAVTGYFNDNNETVTQEAVRVTARMLAPPFNSSSNSSNSASATLSLLEGSFGPEIRQQVEQQILEMNADEDMEEGFVSLFNGIDLSGWTGSTDAYKVEDGQIISLTGQSGNLFTEDEYSNFNLKFDFKLTPGANNGIGIRTPSDGHAAYDGMELQVLDNTAEKYADLEAYQYHGSVYGVAAAERGHLNPVGEWNSQEVIARDSQITIILNGETILETDIREASTPHTLDGREHPGLLHDSGHIVLLGHNDEVAFRNIFVQDLDIYLPNYDTDGEESENQDPISRQPIAEVSLFNGQDLAGWERVGVEDGSWHANDGILSTEGEGEEWEMGGGGGWLSTENTYDNFILELEYRIPEGGNSGVFLRAPREGDPAYQGMEIQLLDDGSEQYAGLNPWQYTGSIYDVKAPNKQVSKPAGEWQKMVIVADGPAVSVTLNGEKIINSNLINHMDRVEEHPGLKRRSGYIGLQN